MTLIRVLNRTRGTVLGSRVRLADGLWSRSRGFLFRPAPSAGEGILLSPCRAVHMYGVRYPLDVVFISDTGQVVATYPRLRPWRRSGIHGSAYHALELPAGTIRATGTAPGDLLSWASVDGDAAALELSDQLGMEHSVEQGAERANGAGDTAVDEPVPHAPGAPRRVPEPMPERMPERASEPASERERRHA
jgi:uncharacterized protein